MQTEIMSGIIARQRVNGILKELFRKIIHICSCFVPFFLKIAYLPTLILLGAAVLVYSLCELFRLKGHTIPIISKVTEIASRKRDENKFVLGPVTLVTGIIVTAVIFPLNYAKIGIYALAFGDGLASLVGRMFGKIVIPFSKGKTVAGSLACFFAVFVVTFLVCGNCFVSLVIGTTAMMIEVLPMADFDNIFIPILISLIYSLII